MHEHVISEAVTVMISAVYLQELTVPCVSDLWAPSQVELWEIAVDALSEGATAVWASKCDARGHSRRRSQRRETMYQLPYHGWVPTHQTPDRTHALGRCA